MLFFKKTSPPHPEPIVNQCCDGGKPRKVKLGILMCSVRKSFFSEAARGIKDASARIFPIPPDIEFELFNADEADKQSLSLRSMLENGINGLICSPVSNQDLFLYLERIAEKIPVITLGRKLDGSDNISHIGCDYIKAGRTAGELCGLFLKGSAHVTIITQSVKMSSLNQRIKGFSDVLKEQFPRISISEIIELSTEQNPVHALKEVFSSRIPDLVYITSHENEAILKAISENDFSGKIITYGGYDEAVKSLIRNGKITVALSQNPYLMGEKAAEQMFLRLSEKTGAQKECIIIENQIIIKENVY